MDLVTALRIAGWTERSQCTHEEWNQALETLLVEAKSIALHTLRGVDEADVEDFASSFVTRLFARTRPLPGDAPATIHQARKYIALAIRNGWITYLRSTKRFVPLDESQACEDESRLGPLARVYAWKAEVEGLDDATEMEARSVTGPLSPRFDEVRLPDGGPDPREGVEGVLAALERGLEAWCEDEELRALEDQWSLFRRAVIETLESLRGRKAQADFAEAFRRCVACAFQETTMEQEVEASFRGRGEEVPEADSEAYRRERARLDQQNSRTLRRILERAVGLGMDRGVAITLVGGLSPRGSRSDTRGLGDDAGEMSEGQGDDASNG